MFSLKPAQTNLPAASLRNQFTWKMRGVALSCFCIMIQWWK